jgi:hypothetical protein
MWLCSQKHISNPMRGSSFQIITFIGLTASQEEKTFSITIWTYAMCAIHTLDNSEAYSKETSPFCRHGRCYIRIMAARVQLKKKKPLVMILKGLGAKMK